MEKTIKEMAEKYTTDYCHELDRDEEGGAWVNIPKLAADSYIAGANAVLEQIEKLTNNQNWCAFPKQSHKELKEFIEQLKK